MLLAFQEREKESLNWGNEIGVEDTDITRRTESSRVQYYAEISQAACWMPGGGTV